MADARVSDRCFIFASCQKGLPKPPGEMAVRVPSAGIHSHIFSLTIAQILEPMAS
jgi:hypothetical protein